MEIAMCKDYEGSAAYPTEFPYKLLIVAIILYKDHHPTTHPAIILFN